MLRVLCLVCVCVCVFIKVCASVCAYLCVMCTSLKSYFTYERLTHTDGEYLQLLAVVPEPWIGREHSL